MNFPDNFDLKTFRKDLLAWWTKINGIIPGEKHETRMRLPLLKYFFIELCADQVVPTYQKFLEKYSSISQLAKASIEELKTLIYPLGLHWRVGLLYDMAQELHSRFGDQIPLNETISNHCLGSVIISQQQFGVLLMGIPMPCWTPIQSGYAEGFWISL